jgi:outer membrane protein OmpA-like peptidoglycan-associated protein
MKNLFLFILIVNGLCVNVFAQEEYNYEKKGDRYYFGYSYNKAIIKYNLAKHLSLSAQRKLADSYYQTDQLIKAEKVYLGIINAPKDILPEDYYNYAMACKANGKYVEADKWMLVFEKLKPTDLRAIDYMSHKIELQNLLKNTNDYTIDHLAINTKALDFGASYFKNKIVFSSSRANALLQKKDYNWTGRPFWKMYVSDIKDGQLTDPILFNEGLSSDLNDGPASFSHDGNFMAFTRNKNHDKSKDRIVELQIYFSCYQNGAWSKPIPFILNNPNYSIGQPCLTSDGKTMYFTSDMPGGFGKADIYSISKNEKGEWANAKNLGKEINTEGNDMFPFITEDQGQFYFTSDGRFGLGGLDIFSCSINQSGFGKVTNVGAPVNTQSNDYGLILNEATGKGYFSSDRMGGSGGDDIYAVTISEPDIRFSIISPINLPVQQRISEIFPLRNYIFFNKNEISIPNRYTSLSKVQVENFTEEQLSVFSDFALENRSKRQLVVYYNVLNILGYRMKINPSATITLVGSSENGKEDGWAMATSVKNYLTTKFEIQADRIFMEGRNMPKIPSKKPGGQLELALLQEGDRRVSVESSFPDILKEFQIGPAISMQSINQPAVTPPPINSPVLFTVAGAKDALTSWSLEMTDSVGVVQKFGPYTETQIAISGTSIMGSSLKEGKFRVTMIGQTKYGRELKKEAPLYIKLVTTPVIEDILRFSVIFEFDDSNSILIYNKFLSEIVTPKIPIDATVVLYGHTDIIGEKIHNNALSLQRLRTVRTIIENSLQKAGRTDVRFEEHWYGEDEDSSPFANILPEERFYNRTVIINIIPKAGMIGKMGIN